MRRCIELPNRDVLVHILEYSGTVPVYITVIRRAEDSDDRWELLFGSLAIHLISSIDGFIK